jgi:ferredoxin
LHRCGGNAKCMTCRCEILDGDAGPIGEAEQQIRDKLNIKEDHVRVSCQVRVHSDLKVKPLMTASETGTDPGPRPQD